MKNLRSFRPFSWLAILLVPLLPPCATAAAEEPIRELATAIGKGDLERVEKLLADGVDPNQRVPDSPLQYTPLFLAVEANQPAITRALLKAGADPKIEDENGDPVMTMAADPEHLAEAKLLIEHGVSIDFKNRAGITALLRVARYAKPEEIQTLVDLEANPNLTDPEGNSALMIAAENDNPGAVDILLKAGAKPNLRNKKGHSAFQLVFNPDGYEKEKDSTPGIVKLLIQSGADINQRDSEGRSLLLRALDSLYFKAAAAQILLEAKPDLQARDKDGQDALRLAVRKNDPKFPPQRLIDLGADVKTVDNDNVDLLMQAALSSNPALVRFFLDQGLSPKSRTKQGSSAVHYAAQCGTWLNSEEERQSTERKTLEILKLLEARGGSLTEPDGEGDTPLHLAARADSPLIISHILTQYPAADLRNNAGETPLHLAAAFGATAVVDLLMPKYPDIDLRDGEGCTPLMNASAHGHNESILRLLKAGADINAANTNGITALAAACARDDVDHMKFLIENGADRKKIAGANAELLRAARQFHSHAMPTENYTFLIDLFSGLANDINALDSDKITALMWVAASNCQPALKALLSHHPDLGLRSPDGRTAMMWAAVAGSLESMKALREAGADDVLRDASNRNAADWLVWSRAARPSTAIELPAGAPPLRERIIRSQRLALQEYLKAGQWNAEDRMAGSSPLHLAAALGDIDAIKALFKLGAPPNQSIWGQSTPLMEATANGRLKAVEFLLEHGADPSVRDTERQRAIDFAVRFGHAEIARLLLRQKDSLTSDETDLLVNLIGHGDHALLHDFLTAGASIPPKDRRTVDSFDRSATPSDGPMQAAALQPSQEFLKILVEFPSSTGADDPDYLITALHFAADFGRMSNVTYLIEDLKVDFNTLQKDFHGGVMRLGSRDADKQGRIEGYSPLSRALENGHEDIVRYLVQHGAIITGGSSGWVPPLSFVIEHRQPELLKLFLENKAPTGLVDYHEETALHVAAALNDAAAVRLLLEHGADPGAKTSKGMTPLDLATQRQAKDCIKVLEGLPK